MTALLPDHAGPCCAELEDIGAVHCGALPCKRSAAKGAYYTVRVDQKLLASHGTSSVILCDSETAMYALTQDLGACRLWWLELPVPGFRSSTH